MSQVLDEVAEQTDAADKAIVLQLNSSMPLHQLLMAVFDPAIKFDTEIPPFRQNKEVDGYASNNLFIEYRRLYIFLDTYKNVKPQRKTEILGQILESIDPTDAILLQRVLHKDFSCYGLDKAIVNEAFPGLIK